MDTLLHTVSGTMESFKYFHSSTSSATSNPNISAKGFKANPESVDTLIHPSDSATSWSPVADQEEDVNPVIRYISDILLDEDLEDDGRSLQDCLALQAAEKSFYEVLHPNENFNIIGNERHQFNNSESENGCDHVYKKKHLREDEHHLEEGRSNKQSVVSAYDDSEPQEMFDKVLLCQGEDHREGDSACTPQCSMKKEETEKFQLERQSRGSDQPNRSKRDKSDEEGVDLTAMLNQCAQTVASYDQVTASGILKKIRQHSSPYGHATQRLAHYFANGLEARLAGTGSPSYSPLLSRQTSAAEILQAYQVYITSSPFQVMAQFFANRTIMKIAENETRLHIIHFGISYGFQWPCLIQHLSERPNGPPKLHITAIEFPQPGFRPAERVEETGRRLARYCAKFRVPFEYDVITQKWEAIKCEDLKIDRNELVVVNCLHRLKHTLDETVMENSPRDAVLKLIKNINPNLFIHGVFNGRYNTPFFATRFKEALLHFYTVFDMFEETIPREDERRMMVEREMCGKDIMNIIACEGVERFERPETYKKWEMRNVRAGLKQLPLDQELLKKVKNLLKLMDYHSNFRIEEDGQWMLQGWKGRILFALSFWKSA